MNIILKERIGERVSALKISRRRALLEAGLEAGFIQDIITGCSQHPGEDAMTSLATVLKCSPAYLIGEPDDMHERQYRIQSNHPQTQLSGRMQ